MLDAEAIKNSKFVAMLPKSEHPWKLLAFQDRIFAVSPGHEPLVLYQDGWKKVMFTEADFETEAGKVFQHGIQQAARINHARKGGIFGRITGSKRRPKKRR